MSTLGCLKSRILIKPYNSEVHYKRFLSVVFMGNELILGVKNIQEFVLGLLGILFSVNQCMNKSRSR